MDERDRERFGERFEALVDKVGEDPTVVKRLPDLESRIVREALDGHKLREIAKSHHVAEGYIMTLMTDVARETGGEARRLERVGLGRDTDPDVTGGHGDTGIGNLSQEPPMTETGNTYEIEEVENVTHEEHH